MPARPRVHAGNTLGGLIAHRKMVFCHGASVMANPLGTFKQWIGWGGPRAAAEAARPPGAPEVNKDARFLPPPVQVRAAFQVDKAT